MSLDRARIAALLRELADAFEDEAVPGPAEWHPRAKRGERKPRALVRPPGEASPAVSGLAERILREKGFR